MGQRQLLKKSSFNYPLVYIQKPKLAKLCDKVETLDSYFIIHNQFVKWSVLDTAVKAKVLANKHESLVLESL